MRFSAGWTGSCHSDEKVILPCGIPSASHCYPRISFYLWIPHGTDGEICIMEVFFYEKKLWLPQFFNAQDDCCSDAYRYERAYWNFL